MVREVGATFKNLIAYLTIPLLVFMFFANAGVAYASPMTAKSLSLSNSSPSAGATVTYIFSFTLPSNSSVHHVDMQFDTQANMAGGLPTGLVGNTTGSSTMTGGTLTFAWNSPTSSLAFGTPEANTGAKTITLTSMTNPTSATVFYAKITSYSSAGSGSPIDSGVVAAATVPVVTVTGQQLESLTVSLAGKTSGSVCSANTVLATTTASAINFDTFNGVNEISAAQTLNVGSNANSGYTAKIIQNQLLTSGGSTVAAFGGATDGVQGTAWVDNTSTGFGICAKGTDAYTTNYGSSPYYWMSPATTAKTIATNGGASASTATDIEFTVAVPANQAAGTYTNQMTYSILANY
ncbi:MAG: hypothetical protein UT66_C0007G0005 [candidate division CPR2 bacterium GW2011_GWC1_39_9]|nr:MAG: hypothetical protein UT66_C0007G0005 [candidate division CPR2 bacterium GW2011_GWC1_39_9]